MSNNRKILEAFAAQFSPPLSIVGTQKIDGHAVRDGFMCAGWDDGKRLGVTAITFDNGQFKAYLESVGRDDEPLAMRTGKVLAETLGRLKK